MNRINAVEMLQILEEIRLFNQEIADTTNSRKMQKQYDKFAESVAVTITLTRNHLERTIRESE